MKTHLCLLLAAISAPLFAADNPHYTYLALGDSVTFGMNDALIPPFTSGANLTPSDFIGYPTILGALLPPFNPSLVANAACPGETSASFLNTSAPDNGCNSGHIIEPLPTAPPGTPAITLPPFKTTVGLHVAYAPTLKESATVSQMEYAISLLETDKSINLVSLMIGANDVLLVLPQLEACGTNPTCQGGVLGPVLKLYGENLAQIIGGIQSLYKGTLVLVTYYAPTPQLVPVAEALNSTMTTVAANFKNIVVANGFTAFQLVSSPFGGNACSAGLLIPLPSGTANNDYYGSPCDIHPSPIGRDLLAATIDFALLLNH